MREGFFIGGGVTSGLVGGIAKGGDGIGVRVGETSTVLTVGATGKGAFIVSRGVVMRSGGGGGIVGILAANSGEAPSFFARSKSCAIVRIEYLRVFGANSSFRFIISLADWVEGVFGIVGGEGIFGAGEIIGCLLGSGGVGGNDEDDKGVETRFFALRPSASGVDREITGIAIGSGASSVIDRMVSARGVCKSGTGGVIGFGGRGGVGRIGDIDIF